MTKDELLDKLDQLASRWESGASIDRYDTGVCTLTVEAYVKNCADELREVIAEED